MKKFIIFERNGEEYEIIPPTKYPEPDYTQDPPPDYQRRALSASLSSNSIRCFDRFGYYE